MSQLFPKSANKFAIISISGALFLVGLILTIGLLYVRSPLMTQQGVKKTQPIAFSHELHVNQIKMDCRFCHKSVEESNFAGIPDSQTCMKCHNVVLKDSPLLAPIRESVENNIPVEWVRIHDLPDHVYFDHSIHVAKGISCVSCHGPIDKMDIVHRDENLQMKWCLDCHTHPEVKVRPTDQVFNMNYKDIETSNNEMKLGQIQVKDGHDLSVYKNFLTQFGNGSYDARNAMPNNVRKVITCSACHR